MNHRLFSAHSGLINPQRYLSLERSQFNAVLHYCQPCTTFSSSRPGFRSFFLMSLKTSSPVGTIPCLAFQEWCGSVAGLCMAELSFQIPLKSREGQTVHVGGFLLLHSPKQRCLWACQWWAVTHLAYRTAAAAGHMPILLLNINSITTWSHQEHNRIKIKMPWTQLYIYILCCCWQAAIISSHSKQGWQ